MARSRILKPEFFFDDDIGALPPLARLLFAGLWTIADREGRLEDRPARIKAQILPYDDVDVEALLNALVAGRFLVSYSANGKDYLQVRTFTRHQNPHRKETASIIPGTVLGQIEDSPGTVLGQEKDSTSPAVSDPVSDPALTCSPPTAPITLVRPSARTDEHSFFDPWYQAYPRKEGRLDALKAWKAARGQRPPLAEMLAALKWQLASWHDPKFIPLPASYLRAGRWADEPKGHEPKKAPSTVPSAAATQAAILKAPSTPWGE